MTAQKQLQDVANALLSDAAGVAIGVSSAGQRVVAVSGVASTEEGIPITSQTLFDLASVSKVAGTTAALMALVSSGDLRLDGRVSDIIPTFCGSADTTLRQLLQHRAGLWEWQPLYLAADVTSGVNAVIDALPLRYRAGTERHYSDIGFVYLGRIIEAVTGLGLAEAYAELAFRPLGMHDTGFALATDSAPSLTANRPVAASSYGDGAEQAMVNSDDPYPLLWPGTGARAAQFGWREHEIRGQANDGNCFHALGGVAGHAGLFSTVDDLLTLTEALGGSDSGSEATGPWRSNIAAQFFAAGPDPEQALGFRRCPIELDGQKQTMLWHPGFTGCAVGFVPETGLGIVLASSRLLTSDPAGAPAPTLQLWQPLVVAAANLHTDPTSSRTS